MLRIIFLGLLSCFSLSAHAQDFSCERVGEEHRAMLADAGLTKCLFPFDVLVAADGEIPDSYVIQTAKIIAQYLDPNRDGEINYAAVHQQWRERGGWIPMPWDQADWAESEEELNEALGYGMIAPRWWMDGAIRESGPNALQRAMLFEEVTHLFTNQGLAYAFPAQFADENYHSSILGRQTESANCRFWQHPENDCPDRPADSPGNCAYPSCNSTEFLYAVIADMNGVDPEVGPGHDYGLLLSGQALIDALSPEFLQMISEPRYGLPIKGFAFDYPLKKAF